MDANFERIPDEGAVGEPPAAAGEDAADVRAILGYFGQERFPYFEFEPPVFPEPPDDVQPIAETLADAPTSVATDDDGQAAEYLEYLAEDDMPPGDDPAAAGRPIVPEAGDGAAQRWPSSAADIPYERDSAGVADPGGDDEQTSSAQTSGRPPPSAGSGTPLGDLFRRIR